MNSPNDRPQRLNALNCLRQCAFALLCIAPAASAQRPLPSDTELHAAYCMQILQNDLADLDSFRAKLDAAVAGINDVPPNLRQQVLQALQQNKRDLQQKIVERQSALNRVELFILPRTQYLQSTILLAATRRAEFDLQKSDAMGDNCSRQCAQLTNDEPTTDQGACLSSCTGGDLESRFEECRKPTWLPS